MCGCVCFFCVISLFVLLLYSVTFGDAFIVYLFHLSSYFSFELGLMRAFAINQQFSIKKRLFGVIFFYFCNAFL